MNPETNQAIIAAVSMFWFFIGLLAHIQIFSDAFDYSTWRKALVSIIFGGPFVLMHFIGSRIVQFLRKFRQ